MAAVFSDYAKAKNAFWFGMTAWQLIALVVAAAPVVAAMSAGRWGSVFGWSIMWLITLFVVVVPIRGRSALGWLAAVVAFAWGDVRGWTTWRSKAAKGQSDEPSEADLPGVLTGIRVHDAPPSGPYNTRVALVQDQANATWAVTAAVTHPGLALADSAERDSQARGLAQLLNACARTELIRELHFMVRSVPDDGAERRGWMERHERSDAPPLASLVNREQAEVLSQASVRTEAFCTIVVPERVLARQAKEFGRGVPARARAMEMVKAEVEEHLRTGLRMTSVEWLTSPALAAAVRTGFAPGDRAGIVEAVNEAQRGGRINPDVPWAQAGPSGADMALRHYSHDAWNSISATMKLPPKGAVIGALASVLVPTEPGERRSLAAVYQIIPQGRADRQTQSAEASADMAEGLRQRLGVKARAKDTTAVARTRSLDAKMASGNALVRAYAVACVTVPKTVRVAEFGRRLDASIRRSGFAPLRLDVSQDAGFVAANIPVGAGLNRSADQE